MVCKCEWGMLVCEEHILSEIANALNTCIFLTNDWTIISDISGYYSQPPITCCNICWFPLYLILCLSLSLTGWPTSRAPNIQYHRRQSTCVFHKKGSGKLESKTEPGHSFLRSRMGQDTGGGGGRRSLQSHKRNCLLVQKASFCRWLVGLGSTTDWLVVRALNASWLFLLICVVVFVLLLWLNTTITTNTIAIYNTVGDWDWTRVARRTLRWRRLRGGWASHSKSVPATEPTDFPFRVLRQVMVGQWRQKSFAQWISSAHPRTSQCWKARGGCQFLMGLQ